MLKKIVSIALAAAMTVSVAVAAANVISVTPPAREGSAALVASGQGNRPFLEWYSGKSMGLQRTQLIYVYANEGETIYFGSSVASGYFDVNGASIGVMMPASDGSAFGDSTFENAPASYVKKSAGNQYGEMNAEIKSDFDRSKVYLFKDEDTSDNNQLGYIDTIEKESAGPKYEVSGTTYNSKGYTPFSITVPEGCGGIWTFMYYSAHFTASGNDLNPTPIAANKDGFVSAQKTTTIAAWDATVVKNEENGTVTQMTGRMACKTLFLNIGKNDYSLNSNVYILTKSGFKYNVDFNGADPYGFVFYANNRGILLNTGDSSQSLMHSAVSSENTLSTFIKKDGTALNYLANAIPTSDTMDETYLVFFNDPDEDFIKVATDRGRIATAEDMTVSNIKDVAFTGNTDTGITEGANASTEGYGGIFTVTKAEDSVATSFKVKLILTGNEQLCSMMNYPADMENVVTLSNSFVNGVGTVSWDGKDGVGNIIPASSEIYKNIKVEAVATVGEVHLPLLDVENNPNGIKVKMLNNLGFESDDDDARYTLYYNNANDSTGSFGNFNGKTVIGDNADYSVNGINSKNGALKYSMRNGDQCAIDAWTYFELTGEKQVNLEVLIVNKQKTALQVIKQWNTTAVTGQSVASAPEFLDVQLQQRIVGTTEWADYTGAVAEYHAPVTMVTSVSNNSSVYNFTKLEWHDDNNNEFEYRVVETPVSGYALVSDTSSIGVDQNTGIVTFNQRLENRLLGSSDVQNNVSRIYKYFYGYEDSAAGIFGTNSRYSAHNDDGYYYLNTEEAATLIYRVRQQEEGLKYTDMPDTSSFTDVPVNGWGRKALEWIKNALGLGDVSGARSTISSDAVHSVFDAHYANSNKTLSLTSTDKVLRIDFLRSYNTALGRTRINSIYTSGGVLLCSKDADGNVTLSDSFINNPSAYIFSSELPESAEEIYQVMLACHSYYVSDGGTVARIAPDLESERYSLDLGLTEANETE